MSDGSPSHRSAVWVLGGAQCVYWGILYYSFAVLLVPMRDELRAEEPVLAGAFSLGLAVWAGLASTFGRWLDRGHGPALLRGGALAAATLLVAWSWVESAPALYLVWAGLGATMAALLYETAFGLLTRAIADHRQRLRALASVTVLGGLASTLFVPLVAAGASSLGWRPTLRGLAVLVLLTAAVLERWALPSLGRAAPRPSLAHPAEPATTTPQRRPLLPLAAPFVATTFAAMALTTLLIPTLVDRGFSLASASWVLATLGVMQLPGRLLLWRGIAAPRFMLVLPLLIGAAGLATLGTGHQLASAYLGVALVGLGGGIHTLARPWVVPQLYGVAAAGEINGTIARSQGIARAVGPVAAGLAYVRFGSAPVFLALAALLLLLLPWASSVAGQATPSSR